MRQDWPYRSAEDDLHQADILQLAELAPDLFHDADVTETE
jgi:hypothetical protein